MAGKIYRKVTGPLGLLLLFSFTISSFRCDPDKDPEFVYMIFTLPISVFPTAQEITVGDTLWITADSPDTLLEYYSNNYYKLSDFDFKMSFGVKKLSNSSLYFSEQPGATEAFQIVNEVGLIDNISETFGDFHLNYANEKYTCKIGLVPTVPGVYSISFLWPIDLHDMPNEQIDLRPVIDLGKTDDGRKRIPVYDGFFFILNEGNTNFDLMTQNCRAGSLENPQSYKDVYYEQQCSFTFRVIE